MAKKKELNLSGALTSIEVPETVKTMVTGEKKRGPGRPQLEDVVQPKEKNSKQQGLKRTHTRNTFIISLETLTRFNNYAFTERLSTKDALDLLLNMALDKEEKRIAREGRQILEKPKK